MTAPVSSVTNPFITTRHENLNAESSFVIDSSVHLNGEVLPRGLLMGLAGGKYRAYAEALVKSSGQFSTGSAAFTLDPAVSPLMGYFRVGDVIESASGLALGTIATYNPTTGVGTLTGNSSSVLATGQTVRVALSVLQIVAPIGRVLKDEVVSAGVDFVGVGYHEGFISSVNANLSAAAKAAMGAVDVSSGETRIPPVGVSLARVLAALGAWVNLTGVDGTASNAAPLAGTNTALGAHQVQLDAIIAALKAAGLMRS